ncbi:hypothetical protein C8R42DRAFT_249617 [Lentinula raphanica]|nr:hypothetical protein C8R42DRAFT_249617 [Lentinula raphanica]
MDVLSHRIALLLHLISSLSSSLTGHYPLLLPSQAPLPLLEIPIVQELFVNQAWHMNQASSSHSEAGMRHRTIRVFLQTLPRP